MRRRPYSPVTQAWLFVVATALAIAACNDSTNESVAGSSETRAPNGQGSRHAVLSLIATPAASPTVTDAECTSEMDEEGLPDRSGVLRFVGSVTCLGVTDSGTYSFTVEVASAASSGARVVIDEIRLSHVTPARPFDGPGMGALSSVTDAPLRLGPGESGALTIEGEYRLADTDEGKKANLHFTALGRTSDRGEPVSFGFNLHLRAPGVRAD